MAIRVMPWARAAATPIATLFSRQNPIRSAHFGVMTGWSHHGKDAGGSPGDHLVDAAGDRPGRRARREHRERGRVGVRIEVSSPTLGGEIQPLDVLRVVHCPDQ